jgi:hypothetical protein
VILTRIRKRSRGNLSRRSEEEVVESAYFIGVFLALLASIPLSYFVLPHIFNIGRSMASAIGLFVASLAFVSLATVITIPFALRDFSSSDQWRLFGKILLVMNVGGPFGLAASGIFIEYVLNQLDAILLGGQDLVGLMPLLIILEFLSVLFISKKFFGDRISRWYHLKPLSEVGKIEQTQQHLVNAEKRMKKNQFERASEEFCSAARVCLSLEDYASAAKYYWSAAEALKNSPGFAVGVSLIYILSASSYIVYGDLEKADEAIALADEMQKKTKASKEGGVSFMLGVLGKIRSKNVQQLSEDWSRLRRKVKKIFGPHGEEMIILLEKNIGVVEI